MTTTRLPQQHCSDTIDHPAHDYSVWSVGGHLVNHCPGRHTGHGFETTAPIAHPMDTDPFAGCDDGPGTPTWRDRERFGTPDNA